MDKRKMIFWGATFVFFVGGMWYFVATSPGGELQLSGLKMPKMPKLPEFKMPSFKIPEQMSLFFKVKSSKTDKPHDINLVTLYMLNGAKISGEIIEETEDHFYILWKGKEVRFTKRNIEHMERGIDLDKILDTDEGKARAAENKEMLEKSFALYEEELKRSEVQPGDMVKLFLKNGGIIEGEFLSRTTNGYALQKAGGRIQFMDVEVDRIERFSDEELAFTPHTATLYLRNGRMVTGDLIEKTDEKYVMIWEGTRIEFEVDEVDHEETEEFGHNLASEIEAKITLYLTNGDVFHGDVVSAPAPENSEAAGGGEGQYVIITGGSTASFPVSMIESVLKGVASLKARPASIYLKDGDSFSGELISKDAERYLIKWDGQIVEIPTAKVDRMEQEGDIEVDDRLITIYLKNGGAISGEIVSENAERYVIKWQAGTTAFKMDEVAYVERGKVLEGKDAVVMPKFAEEIWTYMHDIVIHLTNGEILDVPIQAVTKDVVTVRHTFEDGGYMEQDIERSKVEYLQFRPIKNEPSEEIHDSLLDLYADMQIYREDNITMFTDSYITSVRQFKKVLRETQTQIYLDFFELFKGRKQTVQYFVVIFDDPNRYIESAITDGVPGWIAPGYFSPTAKVLYLYNMVGDPMQDFIKSLMKYVYGGQVDMAVNYIESKVDERYHVFIEGQAKGIKDKYWEYFEWYLSVLKKTTMSVLQHEFAHSMFSSWELVGIVVSKIDKNKIPHLQEKKKFLESNDIEQKKKTLMELMTLRSQEPPPQIEAANSWLAEGLATYCETSEIGDQNDGRLFEYQKMMRESGMYPLDQLTVYKIGSFPGVYFDAMLNAYAQSWALVKFFMEKYHTEFLRYIERIATQPPEGNQDIEWLEAEIGKDRRTLEAELREYMQQYPELDDPLMQLMDRKKKLHDSLVNFGDVRA